MGHRFLEKMTTFFFDALAINGAFWLAFWLRFHSNFSPAEVVTNHPYAHYVLPSIILTVVWLLLFFFTGLYRAWFRESRLDEFLVVARTIISGTALFFIILISDQFPALLFQQQIPVIPLKATHALLTYSITLLISATSIRFILHTLYAWIFSQGIANQNLVIIGANSSGLKLVESIKRFPQLGYTFAGFIDDTLTDTYEGHPIVGTTEQIPTLSENLNINGLIISRMSDSAKDVLTILNYCWDEDFTIYLEPSLRDVVAGHLKTHAIAGIPLIVLLQDHMPKWQAQIKRLFDVTLSLLMLPLFFIMWAIVKITMKVVDPGPALYTQERIGLNGKPFIMIKFRSMYTDAETRGGPQWATDNDPRITSLGRFMRKSRIDEIPQVINVLRGDMSFVGPRPERQHFIELLSKEIPWYMKRLKMKPGVTGWAQVKHKYDETIDDVKTKVMYDLYYFENMSLVLDMKIILQTIVVVFTGKGAK